jgi:translation initiation factor IF-1
MPREDHIELEGTVREALPGGSFRVELDQGHEVIAYLAGKLRRNRIRVVPGDRVTVAISPYDPKRGMVVYRSK